MFKNHAFEYLKKRYATKQFDSNRKIPAKVWSELEDALILTPSAYGMQLWKFVVVKNQTMQQQLLEASYGQKQVVTCSHLLVLCAKDEVTAADVDTMLDTKASQQNIPRLGLQIFEEQLQRFVQSLGDKEGQKQWIEKQVYIALGQFMVAAAQIGVDTCPMEGINPQSYDEIIKVPSGYHTLLACPAGYRSVEDVYAQMPKFRYNKETLIEYR